MTVHHEVRRLSITASRTADCADLQVQAFASAATLVMALLYVLCMLAILVIPDLLWAMVGTWFHGIALEQMRSADPGVRLDSFVIGLLTLSVITYLSFAAFARLYNLLRARDGA